MNMSLARRGTTMLSIVVTLALTSCGADREPSTLTGDTRSSVSTTVDEPSATGSVTPAPVAYTLKTKTHMVHARLSAPDRFRLDSQLSGRLHFLANDVVTDNQAERWADFFLFAPTRVHDPSSQELVPAPRDLASWLSTNPTVRVLSTRTYDIDGRAARELNVERDGSRIFPGDEAGWTGLERYVLWRVDDVWLVGEASTFRGAGAVTAPSGRRDPFASLLRSARLVERS